MVLQQGTKSCQRSATPWLQHPWLREHGVAPDKPLDSVVISRLRNFAGELNYHSVCGGTWRGCMQPGAVQLLPTHTYQTTATCAGMTKLRKAAILAAAQHLRCWLGGLS